MELLCRCYDGVINGLRSRCEDVVKVLCRRYDGVMYSSEHLVCVYFAGLHTDDVFPAVLEG